MSTAKENVKQKVLSAEGKEVGSIDLDPAVFGTKSDPSLVHQMVRLQRAARRAGTHSTQTRGQMEGGGKKPWKQKGTGRARAGTNTSPVWVGGGVAHGPSPRTYDFLFSKKNRRQALCTVLSDKVENGKLLVVDDLKVESGKTKDMVALLSKIGVAEAGASLIMAEKDELVWRSSRNVPNVTTLVVAGANVYDLLRRQYVVCTQKGIEALQDRLLKQGQKQKERSGEAAS